MGFLRRLSVNLLGGATWLPEALRPFHLDSILFEVTPRCNLHCGHCYNVWKDGVDYPQAELPTARARELLERAIRQSSCRQVTFTGGEPTLREDLEALVACAVSHGVSVSIITNGTALPPERVRRLIQSGVGLFELPLNAADRTIHDRLAGVDGSFDRVTAAAAEIRYQGGRAAFVFVATRHNIDQWGEVLELGTALGARGFLFNRYNAGGECHGHPEELMPSPDQVKAGLAVAEAFAVSHGASISASIALPPCLVDPAPYPHVGFGFCGAGTSRAYTTLDPLGNVRPCNHTPTVLGNLFETPLRQLVESNLMKEFCQARPGFCSGCLVERQCLGGCKAAAQACYGDLSACEPFLAMHLEQARRP